MSLHKHIIFAAIAAIHLQSCCLCYGFTTSTQTFKSAAASTSDVRSATALSSTTSSQQIHEVIATSPALGGDVIRINSGPDEDDSSGFLTALGVPTYAVRPATTATDANANAIKLHGTTQARRLGLEGVLRNSNAFILENA